MLPFLLMVILPSVAVSPGPLGGGGGAWMLGALTLEGVWTSVVEYLWPYWESFKQVFVGEDLFIQLGAIAGAVGLAYVLNWGLLPLFRRMRGATDHRGDWIQAVVGWLAGNLFRILLVSLLWAVSLSFDAHHAAEAEARRSSVAVGVRVDDGAGGVALRQTDPAAGERVAGESEAKNYILIRAVASVATLLLVSVALPRKFKEKVYFKALFFILAIGLILNLLGVWGAIRDGLNRLELLPISDQGTTRVTVLTLLKGLVAVLLIIPLSAWLMRVGETRVKMMGNVSPALQVLIIKVLKTLIVVGAVLLSINAMGVNLTAFAVFGGAVGLGLGFGFQKVVSNLMSGVILLGDRSIKPGDVIQVDDTYGWINKLSARYASVITRDGTEHLIPNETLITEKVVNWSFSDDKVRIKLPFGVSYKSNIHRAMELAVQAANDHPRVLDQPAAVVRLMGFGDNSVDFELRVWIRDPSRGVNNLKSDIYVAIWDLFHEHGIEFPFPQRDVHVKDLPELRVQLDGGEGSAGERE